MLQNHAWIRDPLKVADRTMDFNVTEYKKFIDRNAESPLQLPLTKYHLAKSYIIPN